MRKAPSQGFVFPTREKKENNHESCYHKMYLPRQNAREDTSMYSASVYMSLSTIPNPSFFFSFLKLFPSSQRAIKFPFPSLSSQYKGYLSKVDNRSRLPTSLESSNVPDVELGIVLTCYYRLRSRGCCVDLVFLSIVFKLAS